MLIIAHYNQYFNGIFDVTLKSCTYANINIIIIIIIIIIILKLLENLLTHFDLNKLLGKHNRQGAQTQNQQSEILSPHTPYLYLPI